MATHLRRLFASAAVALAVAAMTAGCVSTTIVADPLTLASTSDLKPVVLSITANTTEVRGLNQITVTRVSYAGKDTADAREDFVLNQIVPGMARDTSLFIGALPPGEYRFSSLADTKTNKILRISDKSALLDHFVVTSDKPVDLGRVVVTSLNTKVIYGKSTLVANNLPLMQRFSSKHAALFTGQIGTGWKATDKPAGGAMVEAYARSRPVGAECMSELADGSVIAASRLGTVLSRSPEGRWKPFRYEGLESLLCATAVSLPEAELLAVGEFNTLLRKPRGEDKLVAIDTGDLPPGVLMRIYGSKEHGWVVAQQRDEEIVLYHSPKLEAGTWKVLRKESVAHNFWNGPTTFFMWKTAQGFGYTTSAGPLRFYNESTAAWTEAALPAGTRVVSITDNPDGSYGLLTSPGGGFAGVFATAWRSKDQGATWTMIELPYKIKFAPVQVSHQGLMLSMGGVMSKAELQVSKDEGRTWTHHAPYDLDRRFTFLKNGDMVDVDGGQWGLFSVRGSKDSGKTWQTEYSNFDRRVYEMQNGAKDK